MNKNPFKIPIIEEDLTIILSKDSYEDLLRMYSQGYRLVNGETISDIASVYKRLMDWEAIDRVDLMIPYVHSEQRNEPIGHRVWYLSQQDRSSKYYNGCFFDLQVSHTAKRLIRKKCKLTANAIRLFQEHPEIVENKSIKDKNEDNH